MRMFKKILPKILFLVISMTLLLLAITLGYSTWTFQSFVRETVDKELSVVSRDIRNEIDSLNVVALEQIKAISYLHGVVEGARNKDREALFRIVKSYQTLRKCEYFTILDTEGNVIIRTSDEKHLGGDSQAHLPCVKKAMEKKAGVYYEATPKVPLAIRAASPVLDAEGNLVGVVTGGFRLDTPEWVKYIKDTFGVESTTFVGKMRHITTLIHPSGPKKGELAIGTELDAPAVLKRVFEEKDEFYGEAKVLGRQMKVYYLPILADSGQVLGLVFAGMPIDVQTGLVWNNFRQNIAIAGVGLLIFIFVLWLVVSRVVGPIKRMTKASKDLSDGILDLDLDVRTGDELEVLAEAFKAVAASLKAKTEVALKISKGDLTTWVPLTSEHDSLGMALIEMRYGFYDSLKDLKSLAESVAEGGNELTQTNGLLVTNTNESASQLKDVSSSLDDLNTQTRNNSENARNAEKLVGQAKRGSSEGLEKMSRMVNTMDAITKSSEEINKIIKVIDDIAFQTNLLALNAAVEAARAGVHGKGFAVVAEEVRNLAARSAKAANETADLIQESIHQVGQGSDAAQETSESLNTITGHVEEVSRIITRISRDSDDQTQRFGQVNSAVAQLSSVAEQNTGTVAEAAEAVTSITATARKLDEITRHFKSNEGGKVSSPPGKNRGFVPVKN